MFGNFLYLIVALLIYATYHSSEEAYFSGFETLFLFFSLFLAFVGFTRIQFLRVQQRLAAPRYSRSDQGFNTVLTRQSIMAVALFALNIYGLSLPTFFNDFSLFTILPTAEALLFLALFMVYMSVVWAFGHRSQQILFSSSESRSSYVLSQIMFAVPVLLPWFILSGLTDIIQLLPFQWPKQVLATTAGEMVYFSVFLLFAAIISPALIQKFWQCRPLEPGQNRSRIENICNKAGLKYRNILYWPIFGGKMITAGVMGLVAKFRYILVTQSLLTFLTPEEIDSVIAHEVGHIKRKHLLFYLLFLMGYMVLSYAAFDLIVYFILYTQPLFRFITDAGLNQATVTSAIFSIVIILMFLIYFRFIFGYFMRNFERQADIYVYALFDSAMPLVSTLKKIAITSGQDPDKPNWHHFSIQERVDYLLRCEEDRQWIDRHESKMKRGLSLFMVAMIVLGGIGYQFNSGEAGKRLDRHFLQTIVERELAKSPHNADLLATLGDLYYSDNKFTKTIQAYQKALVFDPENAHVLNNLAWLYATCPDESLQNPIQALYLAEKAIRVDQSSHIWDTLAECYFINGRYREAIQAAKRALSRAESGKSYYQKQLEKFQKAYRQDTPF